MAAVNHPPTPVLANVNPVMDPSVDCEALKAKYAPAGAPTDSNGDPKWTGLHGQNRQNPISGHQSHHVMQNALMRNSAGNRLITAYSGFAAMLGGGSAAAGSEHDIANKWQAFRRRADQKSLNPRPTFGDMKRWAKNDLAAAFQHGKPSRGMSKKEAEQLADCLTLEAEKQVQQHRKDNGMPRLNDNNRVSNSPRCFPLGTLVWTSQDVPVAAQWLEVGDLVETSAGTARITRIDFCCSQLVEIRCGEECVALSPDHRVRLADGRLLAADRVRAGHRLCTRTGEVVVSGVSRRPAEHIVGFGVASPADCFIGREGIAVEATSGAPAVVAEFRVEG